LPAVSESTYCLPVIVANMKSKIFTVIVLMLITVGTWVACTRSGGSDGQALPDQVSYNFHIRPLLSDKCFKCHGPDVNKREAGLRLDIS
jgi:hypothetical protein